MPSNHSLRSRLSFSNVVSAIALFVALGGSAYAAGVLPANSVGRTQLQANAVTGSKIAANSIGRSELKPESVTSSELSLGSVGLHALDPTLRAQLAHAGVTGPQGAPGAPGAPGDKGAQGVAGSQGVAGERGEGGPGAVRIHYSQHASSSPSRSTVTEIAGLRLEAQCEDTRPGTQLGLAVSTPEAATGMETISIDGGIGELTFGESHTANLQFHLPAGETLLGGPSALPGEYSRIFANLIYIAPSSTADLTIALVLDGSAGTCAIDGIGVPASG
jgi:hypothetical protein